MRTISKPEVGEYAPYAIMYIDLLPDDGQVLAHMAKNMQVAEGLANTFMASALVTRPAPDEWTIKEILSHIVDDERIYCYRALHFARNDQTELPSFEQDRYVKYSRANERPLDDILAEYRAVRQATLTFFNSLDDVALMRSGVANGHRMSVRAAAYHIAGHELHHLASIRKNFRR